MPKTRFPQESLTLASRLDELVALISARVEAGASVDLAELTVDCPQLRERLEMLLPTLQAVVELEHSFAHTAERESPAVVRRSPDLAHPAISDSPPLHGQGSSAAGILGDFRILREVGRGGMGVVYEAEQISLGRRVALKVLPFAAMLDRQQLARFKNEARAAATLDHPNIVAIHSVGCERGVHYYAMQLIEGQSLAQVVEQMRSGECGVRNEKSNSELHTPHSTLDTQPIASIPTLHAPSSSLPAFASREYFRTIAQLGIQAAEALDHAHQNGILHRDIKPANLLVEFKTPSPLGASLKTPSPLGGGPGRGCDDASHLKLWITDFGLARMEADAGMTMTGDILGTLRYMSPEQALAKRVVVDHRSDIYSLGVTLYELLTLQPAYTATDRQELLHQIAFDEPRPPRQINPHIPADLETIVLKAMRKDPEHRYATAHDLADDLQRFLDDQPIKAKPPTWREHAVRWTRRHPAAIWAAVLFLLATTLISAASAVLITNAYDREKAQRELADLETKKAKAVSDLLQEMLGSADAASAKGVDYKVGEMFDDFAARLGSQLSEQPEVEADIRAIIGRAYRSLKLPEKAQPHFEKAIEIRRQIDGPQSEKLAGVLVDGAWNLLDQQRQAEAESQVNEAIAIYRRRGVAGAPLFHSLEILQHILRGSAGRELDAERVTRRVLAVARQSGQEFPDEANLLHRYADLKISQGKFVEAEQLARQSVDMHYRLHGDRHPETAFGLKTLARALRSQQKFADAENAVREALKVFRHQFQENHPNIHDTLYQLRSVLEARRDEAGLEALVKEEAAIAMRLGSPDYHVRLAELLLANETPTDAQKEEARRHIWQAIEEYGHVAVESPRDLDRRVRALDGYAIAIGPCVAAPGFEAELEELNRRLKTDLPQLLAAFPNSSECQWWAAMIYRGWAFELIPYGNDLPTAEYALGESTEILEQLSLSDSKRPDIWLYLFDTYAYLGDTQWRLAKRGDAGTTFRRAIETYSAQAADIFANPTPKGALGNAVDCVRVAYFLACNNRNEEAAEFVRNALLAAKHLTGPDDSIATLFSIAFMQLRLGDSAGYRATCKALVDLPVENAGDLARAQMIWTWCLAPDSLEDRSLAVKRAEEFAAHNSFGHPHVDLYLLGAALFRDGQYDRAAEQLKKSFAVYPANPLPGLGTINFQRLLLAMTTWRQGQRDEARRLLAEAQQAIDEEFQSPATHFVIRTILEVLRSEAEAMIEPKKADEAVENKEGPDKESASNSLNRHQKKRNTNHR